MPVELTGDGTASARTYSASRDNSESSSCSDVSTILGEGMLLVLERGMLVGELGLYWEEDRGDLRRTAESRFEKKAKKAGMRKRSRVGEDGVLPGHLLTAALQTDAQRHADQPRRRADGATLPDRPT